MGLSVSFLLRLLVRGGANVASREVVVSIAPGGLVLSQGSAVLGQGRVLKHEGVFAVSHAAVANLGRSFESVVRGELSLEVDHVLGSASEVLLTVEKNKDEILMKNLTFE